MSPLQVPGFKGAKGSLGPRLPLTTTRVKPETAMWAAENIPLCFQMPVRKAGKITRLCCMACAEDVFGRRSDMWNT